MKNLSILISTLFGIGYFPKAPGTAGTLAAVIVYLLLPVYWFTGFTANIILLAAIIVLSILSVRFVSKAEETLGHDCGKIVIDEFWGYLIAVLFLPKTVIIAISAFILFRIFDIFKPEPVNVLQKLPNGWGVMADDIMAGIYANICLQILVRFLPNLFN